MKQCFYCGGQFGLTRRKLWGRQFCSLWCLAWFENAGRERKKAEELRASSHTRFVDTGIASDIDQHRGHKSSVRFAVPAAKAPTLPDEI
jgi:hypothetical protein